MSFPAERRLIRKKRRKLPHPPVWLLLSVLVGVAVLAFAGPWFALSAALASGVAAWLVLRMRGKRRVKREDEAEQAASELASALRVGLLPAAALEQVALGCPMLQRAALAAKLGSSVPEELEALASTPGYGEFAKLAQSWRLSELTGASLDASLGALATRLRQERKLRQLVESELASAKSTGRTLAVLPVAGLVIGLGLGGNPLEFFASVPGQIVLAVGVAFEAAGLVWVERLAD
jgi:tight adherence protein B